MLPVRGQAITLTNAHLLLNSPLETNFRRIIIKRDHHIFDSHYIQSAINGTVAIK